MRFRPGVAVASAEGFATARAALSGVAPVRLVCIVQRGGVETPDDVRDYLDWAIDCGVDSVIFREFSRLGSDYKANATARHIAAARIPVETLMQACLAEPGLRAQLTPVLRTHGYYFDNLRLRHARGIDVVFEWSDYRQMHRQHASGRVYKLVLFPDGRLCSGWDPDHHLLLDFADGQQ